MKDFWNSKLQQVSEGLGACCGTADQQGQLAGVLALFIPQAPGEVDTG